MEGMCRELQDRQCHSLPGLETTNLQYEHYILHMESLSNDWARDVVASYSCNDLLNLGQRIQNDPGIHAPFLVGGDLGRRILQV